MDLSQKLRQGSIKRIIKLINKAAKNGYYEVDLTAADIYFSEDMISEIKTAFNENELRFDGTTITINMNLK